MTGHTASLNSLLAWGFRFFVSRKSNVRKSVRISRLYLVITFIINRQTWPTWHSDKWPLARNPDRSWWHCHITIKLFLATANVFMYAKNKNGFILLLCRLEKKKVWKFWSLLPHFSLSPKVIERSSSRIIVLFWWGDLLCYYKLPFI